MIVAGMVTAATSDPRRLRKKKQDHQHGQSAPRISSPWASATLSCNVLRVVLHHQQLVTLGERFGECRSMAAFTSSATATMLLPDC